MNLSMQRLQAADRALGRVACVALQPLRWWRALGRRRPAVERVLLIKFWGIGSIELLTPAVRTLRRRHPGAELVLLTLSQNRAFAEGLGLFDLVLPLDVATPSWRAMAARILGLVRALRGRRFDLVYDFEFFTRFSAVISMLSGAPRTRGFASPATWRGGFHHETVPFNRYWHVARNFRCLAGGESGLDVEPEDVIAYRVSAEHRVEAAAALFAAGVTGVGPLVVLNPNAGALSLERRWPRDRFAELARKLVLEDGARVALIGAGSETEWTAEVVALSGELPAGRLADLSGRLSIGGLHALLESAEVFVSNDSGPMHLGAALGTPTIGLFGPETPVMYHPLGHHATVLYDPPACSPCINVHDNKFAVCWRGRPECLMNLSVELVLARARDELATGRRPRWRVPAVVPVRECE
jgi:ADP-heptose:LPS heptosyltransferase